MREVILDTNTLIDEIDISQFSKVHLPITVLEELDSIKHKSDGERNYKARKAIRQIEEADNVEYKLDYSYSLPLWLDRNVPDNRILGFAKDITSYNHDAVLISNDINVLAKAKALGIPCEKYKNDNTIDIYKGYKEVTLNEYEMSLHYQCPTNKFGLLNNEFLLIKDNDGNIVDKQRWNDKTGFTPLNTKTFKSIYFDDFKPRDVYQMMAMDSLYNSNFSLLFGVAGSAKTALSLSYIMQCLTTNKANKCVMIFNPMPLKNNSSLGYYPGDRNTKLLSTNLGGILSSKFGDLSIVESLITTGKLLLVPTSEIRGIEVGEKDILYVTEAQNTDAYTMRTIIQRAKNKIIVEGDMLEQQDIRNVSQHENGMFRAIDAFKGTEYFSCVKLKYTYRSPMAEIAQRI